MKWIFTRQLFVKKKMTGINRQLFPGTANIISVCKQENVARLIYCSTVDVVIGFDDIIDGTEENTAPPTQYLFPGYPESKYKAECLVLRANGTKTKDGNYHMSHVTKKPVFGVFDQVRLKPVCLATETS